MTASNKLKTYSALISRIKGTHPQSTSAEQRLQPADRLMKSIFHKDKAVGIKTYCY